MLNMYIQASPKMNNKGLKICYCGVDVLGYSTLRGGTRKAFASPNTFQTISQYPLVVFFFLVGDFLCVICVLFVLLLIYLFSSFLKIELFKINKKIFYRILWYCVPHLVMSKRG